MKQATEGWNEVKKKKCKKRNVGWDHLRGDWELYPWRAGKQICARQEQSIQFKEIPKLNNYCSPRI